MVGGLEPALQNPRPAAGVIGGIGQHFGKERLGHMVRAGAGHQDASRPKQPHGPVIDFFVAAEGAFEAFLVFGKGGRIQDDGVVLSAFLVPVPEKIESIGFDAFDVRKTVPFNVRSGERGRGCGDIDRLDVVAQVADLDGKTAHVTESIEGPAPRIAAGGAAGIALVEIGAGFLAGSEGNGDLPSIFINDSCFRERIANEFLLEFEPFEFPHLDIISKEYGTRLIPLGENGRNEGLDPVGGLNEALRDDAIAVAVDDQPGQQVAFGVDAAAQQRIDPQALAHLVGRGEPFSKEFVVDRNILARQKSKRNLGPGAEECFTDSGTPFFANRHDASGLDLGIVQHIAPVYPKVAAADPIGSVLADDNGTGFHKL